MTRQRAPKRRTQLVYTAGGVFAGACLVVAVVLELAGRPADPGSFVDPAAITSGVVHLTSWGWASLGVWLIIATPAVALVMTATEYRAIGDRRALWTTVAVLVGTRVQPRSGAGAGRLRPAFSRRRGRPPRR